MQSPKYFDFIKEEVRDIFSLNNTGDCFQHVQCTLEEGITSP